MKRKAITRICIILTAIPLLLAGCTPKGQIMDGDGMLNTYRQISQEEAKKMMTADDGHIIVDVRRQDEYEAGHIPGAILIPNEAIGTERPEELPDTEQVILIYCRSGRRSKEAAQKLFDMGYRKIYEFGGIIDWTGDIVTGSDPDGDSGSTEDRQGDKESSGGVSGSEQTEPEETDYGLVEPSATLVMEANGRIFYPEPEDNSSAESFLEKLNEGKLQVELHDYGNFEKVGPLPWELERNDESITTEPGDIILYQGNQITVYYDQNTWSFTRLAKIEGVTKEELLEVLGEGDVTVSFWLEWSE